MLDWIESDDDRLQALLNRYRSGDWHGRGLAAARPGLATPKNVADWLRGQALAGGEGWVAGRMRFHYGAVPGCSDLVLLVGRAHRTPDLSAGAAERRSEFLEYLYGRMHSTRRVAMFQ